MEDHEEVVDLDQDNGNSAESSEEHARLRGDFLDGDADETAPEQMQPEKSEKEEDEHQEADVTKKDQGISIPKARFDEVNARMKLAEQALEALTAAQSDKQPSSTEEARAQDNTKESKEFSDLKELSKDIAKKTRQSMDALIDGDEELYEQLSTEIEDARAKQVEIRAGEIAERTVRNEQAMSEQRGEYSKALSHGERIAEDYPILGADGDTDAIETFVLLRDNMMAKGLGRIEAMDSALEKVAKMFGLDGPAKESTSDSERMRKNLERKNALSLRQPPRVGGVGNRASGSTAPTKVEQMSDDEFSKLSDRDKKSLRGDYL